MALSRLNRLLVIGLFTVAAFGMVLLGNEPEIQYTVDEVMKTPSQHSGDVHLRGTVIIDSYDPATRTFTLGGGLHNLTIDASSSAIPPAFEEGRVVAIKGELSQVGSEWRVVASEIITGCPSKYEAATE
jgi:cytochrome c-type biogenesis protein CcmE